MPELLDILDDLTYALEFTPNQVWNAGFIGHNAYHGHFWTASATPGNFFADAWACASYGAEYVISGGYGGAHPILLGFNGATSGKIKLTGNVYDGSSNVSITSVDGVDPDTWHHIGLGLDQTANFLYLYLDGILTDKVAFSGTRTVGALSSDLGLYMGGSDHSNFKGKILRVRIFEGAIPFTGGVFPASFNPEMVFRSTMQAGTTEHKASFLTDYSKVSEVLPDYSAGYNGGTHSGSRQIGNNGFRADSDSKLPQWVAANFIEPTFLDTPESIPPGAVVFDDFSRGNQIFTWRGGETSEYPWLGTARTGEVWEGFSGSAPAGQGDVGILEGSAVGLNDFNLQRAWIPTGVTDYIITTTRKGSGSIGVILRQVDTSNYLELLLESGTCTYKRVEAGGTTFVGGGSITNTAWTSVVITVSGTSVSAAVGGDTFPLTETVLTTGEDVGFSVSGTGRVDRFLVM